MKITPESAAGQKLFEFEVSAGELRATSFLKFNWQKGAAITLALPFGRCAVLIKGKYMVRGPTGDIAVGPHLATVRHELCHVAQAREWGFFGYWRRHLWARVKHRSLLARDSDVEQPCYEAGDKARARL